MTTRLTAFLCYRDPDALVGWIREVLGFEVVRSFGDGRRLAHAELRRGDAVVCVQADDVGYDVPAAKSGCVGSGLVVVTYADGVRDAHERAVARGTPVLIAPETTPWGNFRVELLDPEGRQWSVGTYLPGEPADD